MQTIHISLDSTDSEARQHTVAPRGSVGSDEDAGIHALIYDGVCLIRLGDLAIASYLLSSTMFMIR
jgi:hypothetical protein